MLITKSENYTMTPTPEKSSLPPLVKQSDTFKLFIPKEVEAKIRYLQNKFPHTEWSGVLFTAHTGSFENKDLVISCVDIYPMDLGSHTYTEFKMSPDVTAYIAENMEKLWDCDLNLVHSHADFQTFFSGTDTATLRSEGNDTNNFVSLIVNNEGTYSAAITRKVKVSSDVSERGSYCFFGEESPISYESNYKTVQEERIEYFMLDIEKEEYENPFSYIDSRFEEIEASKRQPLSDNSPVTAPVSPISPVAPKPTLQNQHFNEPSFFSDEEMGSVPAPDTDLIYTAVSKLLLCSLIVNPDKIDMAKWVGSSMMPLYNKTFTSPDSAKFKEYCDWAVEYILDHYEDDNLIGLENAGDETYLMTIASAFIGELESYMAADNPYINAYIESFRAYTE